MVESKEHSVIEACKTRIESNPGVSGSGVVMELYEFEDKSEEAHNVGYFFQPTNTRKIWFPKKNDQKNIKGASKEVKLWTKDLLVQSEMEQIVGRGLKLKHPGILKPLFCAESVQLSKVVLGCTKFDLTLQDWIDKNGAQAILPGDYFSGQGKDIVRSGLTAIDHIWENGCSCSDLDDINSYVMSGGDIKILPFAIHPQLPEQKDEKQKLDMRTQFADMLDKHIGPLWGDDEFKELTKLMRDQRASTKAILGHPVLSSPSERLIMYRNAYSSVATHEHATLLNDMVTIDADWAENAKRADLALRHILNKGYTCDVEGALYFARIVSCHYAENLAVVQGKARVLVAPDFTDRLLKYVLPLVLCQWYNVKSTIGLFMSDARDS